MVVVGAPAASSTRSSLLHRKQSSLLAVLMSVSISLVWYQNLFHLLGLHPGGGETPASAANYYTKKNYNYDRSSHRQQQQQQQGIIETTGTRSSSSSSRQTSVVAMAASKKGPRNPTGTTGTTTTADGSDITIRMVWVYNDPPEFEHLKDSFQSIISLVVDQQKTQMKKEKTKTTTGEEGRRIAVQVYCGSLSCIHRVWEAANFHGISSSSSSSSSTTHEVPGGGVITTNVELVNVKDIFVGTSLESWIDYHVLAKLLGGHHYEHHLQVATQLALLLDRDDRDREESERMTSKSTTVVVHLLQPAPALAALLNGVEKDDEETTRKTGDSTTIVAAAGENNNGVKSSESIVSSQGGLWGVSTSYKKSPVVVESLMDQIVKCYSWDKPIPERYSPTNWPVQCHFESPSSFCDSPSSTSALSSSSSDTCEVIRISDTSIPPPVTVPSATSYQSVKKNYATLSFDARRAHLLANGNPGMNIGDEMQGLAGIQFLPRVDAFVERDRLDVVRFTNDPTAFIDNNNTAIPVTSNTPSTVIPDGSTRKVHLFLNAWYGTPSMTWPPPDFIEPVTVAMHFQPAAQKKMASNASKAFFHKHEPIGTRDTGTQQFFLKNITDVNQSVKSFFTACMTMSLTFPPLDAHEKENGPVLIVDVTQANEWLLKKTVPRDILPNATRLTHKVLGEAASNNMMRFVLAFEKLVQYRHARLVITERLHVALPCVAVGTPVIFLHGGSLIGGGGNRLAGLDKFMHFVHGSQSKTTNGWDFAKPPPNPIPKSFRRFSSTIKHFAACHTGISDSARMYGMVPLNWRPDDNSLPCSGSEEDRVADETTVRIATVLDQKYLFAAFPSWIKAISNHYKKDKIVLYILTHSMSDKQLCLLRHTVGVHLPHAILYTIPVDLSSLEARYKGLWHISVATQARLYLPSLLPCVDKVLFLDQDAFVMSPLDDLWKIEPPECGVAARSSTYDWFDRHPETEEFQWNTKHQSFGFNAGVMLLSLNKLRKLDFEGTLVRYFAEVVGTHDQFVFNNACNGTHKELHARMNVFQGRPEETPPRKEWMIVHYQGFCKPWKQWCSVNNTRPFMDAWKTISLSFDDSIKVTR